MPPYEYVPPYVRRSTNSHNPLELATWKHELAKSVKAIEAYGDFATSKTYTSFTNPGLEVVDVKIPLPLPDLYADQIKAVARSAPFGRGDETVVDHSVRLTWELSHDEFRVTNPSWQSFLDHLIQEATNGLGLKPDEIRVEPYKLLLYEKGSFFKPHKDSEKTPGMIGSMVVCLPSPHEGGDVHLSHAGNKSIFATAPSSAFDLKVLAWYSDVTHEVKEVTSGHRLALTFNIIQTSGSGKSGSFFLQQQVQLRGLIERWQQRHSDLERLVIFTDHKYTPQSLSATNLLKTLKGRDRAVLESLRNVCAETGIYILLAKVQKKSRESYGLYGYDLDQEEEEEEDDIGVWMDFLCDLKGKELATHVAMDETDILGPNPYQGRRPDETEEGEFTGNESQPDMYRYHNSAIVLIPRERLFTILDHTNTVALTSLVMEQYMNNPGNQAILAHASDFLSKALVCGNAVAIRSTVLTMAWRTKNDELYRNAVRSYTASGEVPDDLVEKLASLLKKTRSATRASECQRCWWEVFCAPVNLTSLFAAAEKFATLLENDDDKASFRSWATISKRSILESRTSLSVSDLGGVMSLATSLWEDRDWITKQLVPKLQESQDKALVSKVIEVLVDKSQTDVMPGAEYLAKEILGSQLSRLRLGDVDFRPSAYPRRLMEDDLFAEPNRFLDLIKVCLKCDWMQETTELLRLSYEHVKQQNWENWEREHWNPPIPIPYTIRRVARPNDHPSRFVCQLAELSHNPSTPFIEPQRKLIEHIIRTCIAGQPPALPPKPEGWAMKPRSCKPPRSWGPGPCDICEPLDAFLVDPDRETGEFCDTQVFRRHMEKRLPGHLYLCTTDPRGRGGRQCQTLIVTKRVKGGDHAEAMEKYNEEVQSLRKQVEHLRTDNIRNVLGDELYGELILMDRPPGSQAAHSAGGGPQAVAGIKREAEDDSMLPPATRQHINGDGW